MMFSKQKNIVLLSIALLLLNSCSTTVDINAPEKPLLVVYGVLNPKQPVQYIRVTKGFLIDGDAVQFAQQNDLSLKNALVTLTEYQIKEVNGKKQLTQTNSYTLTPLDTVKNEGTFYTNYTIFKTQSSDTIRPGHYYELNVKVIGNETLETSASTTIPSEPLISQPTDKIQVGTGGVLYDYPTVEFYTPYEVKFLKGRNSGPNQYLTYGRGFELRIYFKYGTLKAIGDTTWQPELKLGPLLFDKSSCVDGGSDRMCYRLAEKSYTEFLRSKLNDPQATYVYDATPLNNSCRIEITSIDTALFNYMLVNSPIYTDLNTVKSEYTNLSNNAVGIFGSINTFQRYINLGSCTKYLAKLNNTPQPPTQCE